MKRRPGYSSSRPMEIGQHSNSLQKTRGLGLLGVAGFRHHSLLPSSASLEKGPKSRMHQNTKEGEKEGKGRNRKEMVGNSGNIVEYGRRKGRTTGRKGGEGRKGKNRGET